MDRVNPRKDWPLGPALKQHRVDRGLSVKAAARRTRGKVSDGRWYQLESGYQQVGGQRIPISTTAATVAAVAAAVDWDVPEALETAGFDPVDVPKKKRSPLGAASNDELLAEVRRRMVVSSVGVEDDDVSLTFPDDLLERDQDEGSFGGIPGVDGGDFEGGVDRAAQAGN